MSQSRPVSKYETKRKKVRLEEEEAKKTAIASSFPSSIIVNFRDKDGETAGQPTDIPMTADPTQLQLLVNSLLENETPFPYAFYINDVEVVGSLVDTITQIKEDATVPDVSFEDTITINYQPLSIFRVRPVTRCVETMPGHTDSIIHLSYSPDGKRLASGGGDMTVRFWNVSTSMPTHNCTGHKHYVLCTGWTPNGKYFISADQSGEIRVWDPATGEQQGPSLRGHRKWVTSLAFEPLHMDGTCTRMASSSKDGTVKVWNLNTCLCETTISGHMDGIEAVKWGGTGLLYTASRDKTIKVWAIDGHGRSQQKLVRTLTGHAHRINSLALNCDFILRTGCFELGGVQKETDPKKQQEIALEKYNTLVGDNGERLVSCSDDFTLFMWTPQESKTPLDRMVGHQQLVNHIAFSPDARFVASASFDKKVKLWNGKTGKFIATLTGHVGAVYQVTWSADSNHLVSASKDSTLKVWSVKDPKKAVNTLAGHEDEIFTVDWSPNGTQLASGSRDRTIRIWHH